jgi:two-component system OmpR family response regulator
MKLLVIEDDADTANFVVQGLKEQGHNVDSTHSGKDGLFLASDADYDVIVLDRRLPGMDGVSVVKMLRACDVTTPVLFVSGMDGIHERVEALDAGGDDYLVKPFAMTELSARVRALGRRPPGIREQTVLCVSDLKLNLLSRTVTRAGKILNLLPREFRLLEVLMRSAGHVLTRTALLEKIWDYNFDPQTNIVETHISRLRAKVDRGHVAPLIHTIRGAGYMLRAPDGD